MSALQVPEYRQANKGVRTVLLVGSLFVFAAGVPLYVGTAQTDRYFAWTIRPPLTAAFLGASYWASFLLGFLCARQRSWHRARLAVPGPLVFTVLTLVATLIHIDRFHFNSPQPVARLVTWAWLFIYIAVPVALAISLVPQLRTSGQDPPRLSPLPAAMRGFFMVLVITMGPLGLGLFVAPAATLALWPWMLTPLTARAVGAWLITIAVISVQTVSENDLERVRPGLMTMAALGALQAVALLRYPSSFPWASTAGGIYLLFLMGILLMGLYGWLFLHPRVVREPGFGEP